MSSPAKQLYAPTVINSMCDEITITPFTHIFISFAMTFVLFVVIQRIFPGNGTGALFVTLITLGWYLLTWIVNVYRDYVFYDRRPNYDVFARCLLNKEYNEKLSMKFVIISVLAQKVVACLLRADASPAAIKIFRAVIRLVLLFGLPAMVGRGVAALGAGIGYGWPFLYLLAVGGALGVGNSQKIQWNPGFLWIQSAETMVTGSDEQQDAAAAIMTAAEGAMIEAGEDVPAGSIDDDDNDVVAAPAAVVFVKHEPAGAATGDENDGQPVSASSAPVTTAGSSYTSSPPPSATKSSKKHVKLNYFADYFDRSTVIYRSILIIGYSVSAYALVISWDWDYNRGPINYGEAFSALDAYRPTAKSLYDNLEVLSSSQKAYIASLWC